MSKYCTGGIGGKCCFRADGSGLPAYKRPGSNLCLFCTPGVVRAYLNVQQIGHLRRALGNFSAEVHAKAITKLPWLSGDSITVASRERAVAASVAGSVNSDMRTVVSEAPPPRAHKMCLGTGSKGGCIFNVTNLGTPTFRRQKKTTCIWCSEPWEIELARETPQARGKMRQALSKFEDDVRDEALRRAPWLSHEKPERRGLENLRKRDSRGQPVCNDGNNAKREDATKLTKAKLEQFNKSPAQGLIPAAVVDGPCASTGEHQVAKRSFNIKEALRYAYELEEGSGPEKYIEEAIADDRPGDLLCKGKLRSRCIFSGKLPGRPAWPVAGLDTCFWCCEADMQAVMWKGAARRFRIMRDYDVFTTIVRIAAKRAAPIAFDTRRRADALGDKREGHDVHRGQAPQTSPEAKNSPGAEEESLGRGEVARKSGWIQKICIGREKDVCIFGKDGGAIRISKQNQVRCFFCMPLADQSRILSRPAARGQILLHLQRLTDDIRAVAIE